MLSVSPMFLLMQPGLPFFGFMAFFMSRCLKVPHPVFSFWCLRMSRDLYSMFFLSPHVPILLESSHRVDFLLWGFASSHLTTGCNPPSIRLHTICAVFPTSTACSLIFLSLHLPSLSHSIVLQFVFAFLFDLTASAIRFVVLWTCVASPGHHKCCRHCVASPMFGNADD